MFEYSNRKCQPELLALQVTASTFKPVRGNPSPSAEKALFFIESSWLCLLRHRKARNINSKHLIRPQYLVLIKIEVSRNRL